MSSTKTESSNRKIQELSLLFEISQVLEQSVDLKDTLTPILKTIAEHMGILRGTITLFNRKTGEIYIESAYGLSSSEKERGKYKIGEGITGMVVQTGEPVIVPNMSKDPRFLNKTGSRQSSQQKDMSFLCVPIKLDKETIGTISADKPYDPHKDLDKDVRIFIIIVSMISQAVRLRLSIQEEREALIEENTRLHQQLQDRYSPTNIIGTSPAMQLVYDLIAQVSKSDATVLIRGESGTGKELVAQAIHYNSLRAEKPFIKVNCSALPETIIESELFGHEKGSFTGAINTRKGRFELANGGTLFLDEIGDLSPQTQVKLLRVLQEKEIERVGGISTIRTNVRVIAATNRDLDDLMSRELFREDLYYRLNVFPIHIPPLRERKTDIMLLANHFIDTYSKANNKQIKRISTPAIDLMTSYHWPGNVRELENCIERAILLSTDSVIHGFHLPPTLQSAESTGTEVSGNLQESIDNLEREMIIEALKATRGNQAKAAQKLGISERIMGLRVKKHSIDQRKYKG